MAMAQVAEIIGAKYPAQTVGYPTARDDGAPANYNWSIGYVGRSQGVKYFYSPTLPASFLGSKGDALPSGVSLVICYKTLGTNVASFVNSINRPVTMVYYQEPEGNFTLGSDFVGNLKGQSDIIRGVNNSHVTIAMDSGGFNYRNGGPSDVTSGNYLRGLRAVSPTSGQRYVDYYFLDCYYTGLGNNTLYLDTCSIFTNWFALIDDTSVIGGTRCPVGFPEYGLGQQFGDTWRHDRISHDHDFIGGIGAFAGAGLPSMTAFPIKCWMYWWSDNAMTGAGDLTHQFQFEDAATKTLWTGFTTESGSSTNATATPELINCNAIIPGTHPGSDFVSAPVGPAGSIGISGYWNNLNYAVGDTIGDYATGTVGASSPGTGIGSWYPLTQPCGGGTANTVAVSPSGNILMGSDMQGVYYSTDGGVHWTPKNCGLGTDSWNDIADVAYSLTEPGIWYAAVGDAGAGGGLIAATDPPVLWTLRSSKPACAGNHATGSSDAWPRSAGRRIIQEGTWLYVASYSAGVMRTDCSGTKKAGEDNFPVVFTMAGAAPSGYFFGIDYDAPSTSMYVCHYNDGIWKSTNPHSGTPNFTKLTNSPAGAIAVKCLDGVIYAACNTGTAQSAGLWHSLDAGATWTQMTDASINTTQVWNSVDGVLDGTTHRIIVATGKTSDAGVSLVFVTIPSHGAGTASYRALVPANCNNKVAPAGTDVWQPAMQLGVASGFKFNPIYDPNDPTFQRVFCPGSQGFFISTDGGVNWQHSSMGADMFRVQAGYPACDLSDKNHLIFGSGDYGSFVIEDGTGEHTAAGSMTCTGDPANVGLEGFAGDIDAIDGESFMSFGDKFSPSSTPGGTGGIVGRRTKGTYTYTQMASPATSAIALGLCTFRNATNGKVLITAHYTYGIARWTYATGWVKVSSVAFQQDQSINAGITYAGQGVVFAFDKKTGIYRSTDYGVTWTLIMSTVTGNREHVCVADPTRFGELWVSAKEGLYRLTNAQTGTVSGGEITVLKMASAAVSNNNAISAGPDGTIYVITYSDAAGTGAQASQDRGATWINIDNFGTLAQLDSNPCHLDVAADSRLYIGGSNVVNWTYSGVGG
jgi:hypothetical protein